MAAVTIHLPEDVEADVKKPARKRANPFPPG